MHRQDAALWKQTDWLLVGTNRHDRGVRLFLHHVIDLGISEEEHHTRLHHVLEDEVLVVVADFKDVLHYEIVEGCLPLDGAIECTLEIVDFFLPDFGIEDFLVDLASQTGWNTTLGVLDQERLIFFL